MTTLICPNCRHENEQERIYCHNCGDRLDRSAVAAAPSSSDQPDEEQRKHLHKMIRGGAGYWKDFGMRFAKLILASAAAGLVVAMLIPPETAPPTRKTGASSLMNMELAEAIRTHRATQLTYSEDEVNSYLDHCVRRANSPAKEGWFPLRAMWVGFDEGACTIGIERQFFGFAVYGQSKYRVSLNQGKLVTNCEGGSIGRLPIPSVLMASAGNAFFLRAWTTLERERKQLMKVAEITFHPQQVAVVAAR